MTDRGSYRAIRRVLLDGPDFRRLPAMVRWVFVALKITMPPAGIDTVEPVALVVTLAAQTGLTSAQIEDALAHLERERWIKREENVVWVIDQLTYDPHIRAEDAKHRKGIQHHVAGLPSLAIRYEFVRSFPAWFADADGSLKTHPKQKGKAKRVIEGSSKGLRSTEQNKTEQNKTLAAVAAVVPAGEHDTPPTPGPVPPVPDPAKNGASWLQVVAAEWDEKNGAGTFPYGIGGKALKPLSAHHTPEKIAQNLWVYLTMTDPRFVSLPKFAQTFAQWDYQEPVVDGIRTEFGERMAAARSAR